MGCAGLPRFIRQTGIDAPARVRRILAAKGPAGVLAEIALIDGGYVKKIYFTELLKSGTLDSSTVRQVLAQASREIGPISSSRHCSSTASTS